MVGSFCRKNLGFVKVYWNWCLDNDLITTSNVIDLPRQMQRKNNTKSQRKKTKKLSNLAYSVEQAWLLHSSAKEENEKLADLILLGMYTGCRIGEVAGMRLEDVHLDRFNVVVSKTESGIRSIPIHTDIMQDVERMEQTSTDGYLISGLSAKNVTNDRSKGIGKRFGRLKSSLGFQDNVHTYHSFRSTLASRFQSAGVEELFTARIIGHKAGGMTYGLYAGDLDWDKAVEAMAKVDYKRAA